MPRWLASFVLLIIHLVCRQCFGTALGPTVPPPRGVNEIANPLIDLEKCGRKGIRSHVCDPDSIMPVEQAYQLDDAIRSIYNDTFCPCAAAVCQPEGQGGYLISIAIIRAMKLELSIRSLNYSRENQAKYMDAVLDKARHFAYQLLHKWNMGRCQEDILIFYSVHDNVLYTVTNTIARKKLTDEIVGEIVMNSRIHFGNPDTITDGFKEMLDDYRTVLLGNYNPKSNQENDLSDGNRLHEVFGSSGNKPVLNGLFLLTVLWISLCIG